jgi:hypothetical protein
MCLKFPTLVGKNKKQAKKQAAKASYDSMHCFAYGLPKCRIMEC